MVSVDGTERFLRAEDEATRLVKALAALRTETENYQTASSAIDQTVNGIASLSDRLREVAEGIGRVTAVLLEIGTPALVERLESIRAEMDSARVSTAALDRSLSTATEGMASRLAVIESRVEAVSSQQSVAEQSVLNQLARTIDSVIQSDERSKSQIETASKSLDGKIDELNSLVDTNSKAVQRVFFVAIVAVALSLVAIILILVL